MITRIAKILGAGCMAAGFLCAQQGTIGGPVSGIVYDRTSHGLRAVLGIPGAAVMGDPIALGMEAANAWVSPLHNSAIVAGTDGTLHWFRLDSGKASEVQFSDAA